MRIAKSAKVHCILGASLVATALPEVARAAIDSSSAQAIDSSSGQAIDSSSGQAIDSSSGQAIDSSSALAIDSSSALSIDSSSGQAIDSSSALAIDSSSGQAIDSSSALAIDSSSGQAIDSSSGQAIDSSSALAIDSSSGQAIDSSSALAIDSSSGQAIDSSSGRAIDSSSGQAIDSSSALAIDSSSSPMLSGPVDSINMSAGTFMAVGQTVSFPGGDLSALAVGDLVTVHGSLAGAGQISATSIDVSSDLYVAGATEVFVTGIPSMIDSSRAMALIGQLEVDYTQSLGSADFDGIGAAITVIGMQPALGGIFLGSEVVMRNELFLGDTNLR